MNAKRYFDNIHRIESIISELDTGNLTPGEAKDLFEEGKDLIKECDEVLKGYSGKVEHLSMD